MSQKAQPDDVPAPMFDDDANDETADSDPSIRADPDKFTPRCDSCGRKMWSHDLYDESSVTGGKYGISWACRLAWRNDH